MELKELGKLWDLWDKDAWEGEGMEGRWVVVDCFWAVVSKEWGYREEEGVAVIRDCVSGVLLRGLVLDLGLVR